MKPINRLFLFLLFISASYAISYAQENQSFFLHTIEKGQSLYSISKMYNVTTSDIIRLNPGCDEKIYAGQTIKIPKGKDTQKGETFHTIQAGETLYKLTTMYNVSAKAICEANPGLSAENFRIGQVILIPLEKEPTNTVQTSVPQPAIQGPVVARCKEMHKVKRKETIFSVSREYEISEQELINANPELKKGRKKDNYSVSLILLQHQCNLHPRKIYMRFLPATANFSVRVKKLRRISRLLKPLCYCLSRKTNVW